MFSLIQSQVLRLEEYLSAGGVVMGPLIMVSLVMWLLIMDRTLFFRRLYLRNMSSKTAWEHIREGRIPNAAQYRGAVSLLVTEFVGRRTGVEELDRHILDEAVVRLNRRLTDYLAIIGVLAAIAPLLGLLGTVTGMIATFDVMAVFGTGNAKAMAGGISEALITTQTGLLVAIPGLYMKGFLDRRARNLQKRVSAVALYLRRHLSASGSTT